MCNAAEDYVASFSSIWYNEVNNMERGDTDERSGDRCQEQLIDRK